MHADKHLIYHSGDLSIRPQLGEVRNMEGESARLGPVNMRVLSLLIQHPKAVISRNELFNSIWKNQVVSDDALTRCISDIRTHLKNLCPQQDFIETLPRRGYRWLLDVSAGQIDEAESSPTVADSSTTNKPKGRTRAELLARWGGRGLVYLAALLFIASASVWLLDRFSQPSLPIIAMLPIQAEPGLEHLARDTEERLSRALLEVNGINLLSKSAVASRPSNPFPYFYFEFGTRWVVEAELRQAGEQVTLSMTLVDARTGIMSHQVTDTVYDYMARESEGELSERSLQAFTDFVQTAAQL